MPYEEGMAIPPGYRRTQKARRPLVIAGTVMLATGYGLSLPIGLTALAIDNDSEYAWLAVPAVGPFVTLAITNHGAPWETTMLLLDGLTQAGGLSLLIAGFVAKEEVIERNPKSVARPAPEFFVGPRSVGMKMKF